MKYAVVFSALATAAMAAKPSFLNTDFVVKEGESFTLKFNNCQGGCTIALQNGPQTNTKDVKVLTSAATGDSFTFTPSDIASGTYNFKITSNADQSEHNYSKQFTYTGTGSTSAATSGASTAASASSASGSSTASASSTSGSSTAASSTDGSTRPANSSVSESTTSMTTVTSSSSAFTTSAPTTTTSERSTSTRTTASATTTIPNAGGRASPLALVAGAVAALAYLG